MGMPQTWFGVLKKLGTAAWLNVGTSANNIVQLTAAAKLPAVDGSLLTNLPGGGGAVALAGTALVVSGAAVDSITFTLSSPLTVGKKLMFTSGIKFKAGSAGYARIYANGDTTDANYEGAHIFTDGSTVAGQYNAAMSYPSELGYVDSAGQESSIWGEVVVMPSGKVEMQVWFMRDWTNNKQNFTRHRSVSALASNQLTSITILAYSAGTIDIGSTFTAWVYANA